MGNPGSGLITMPITMELLCLILLVTMLKQFVIHPSSRIWILKRYLLLASLTGLDATVLGEGAVE